MRAPADGDVADADADADVGEVERDGPVAERLLWLLNRGTEGSSVSSASSIGVMGGGGVRGGGSDSAADGKGDGMPGEVEGRGRRKR